MVSGLLVFGVSMAKSICAFAESDGVSLDL